MFCNKLCQTFYYAIFIYDFDFFWYDMLERVTLRADICQSSKLKFLLRNFFHLIFSISSAVVHPVNPPASSSPSGSRHRHPASSPPGLEWDPPRPRLPPEKAGSPQPSSGPAARSTRLRRSPPRRPRRLLPWCPQLPVFPPWLPRPPPLPHPGSLRATTNGRARATFSPGEPAATTLPGTRVWATAGPRAWSWSPWTLARRPTTSLTWWSLTGPPTSGQAVRSAATPGPSAGRTDPSSPSGTQSN